MKEKLEQLLTNKQIQLAILEEEISDIEYCIDNPNEANKIVATTTCNALWDILEEG